MNKNSSSLKAILAGLLVAAALAIAPGVALARGGGGHGSHGGDGFHRGFTHHGFESDRSFHFRNRSRHDHDRFFGHHFVFGSPWPGSYDPYYLGAYPYDNYATPGYSGVILAVQRALAQLDYYHGPLDGIAGPQTERAIRWFQSADRLPVTGEIDSATLRALRIG
jgi:Putative peptidoglycan binding domain